MASPLPHSATHAYWTGRSASVRLRRALVYVCVGALFLTQASATSSRTLASHARPGRSEPANPAPGLDEKKEHQREYTLKAAFLHHFFKYTTWPDQVDEDNQLPLVLWVVGDDPFGEIIDKTFKGKVIQGRTVSIARKAALPDTIEAHMVFAGGLNDKDRQGLLKLCRDKPTLLVGETDNFAISGAHANFYIENSRVHFEINTSAVKLSKLAISSELLKLARIVKTKDSEEEQE